MVLEKQSDQQVANTVGSVILAGGRASRMGGADKTLLPLAGKPLLTHAIARLAPQVSTMVISANGDLSRLTPFGLPVIADSLAEYSGPLAGLLAGLEWHAEHRPDIRRVASVPTDTPFFPLDLVARFLAEPMQQARPLVARSESGVHPVIGLWPVEIAPDLREALKQGMRKVGAWAELQSAVEVSFPQSEINGKAVDPFFNINRPEDLAKAEALLKAS
ncbi:MAG: molybdenum cofactor guanylyltransferase MobA [Methyloceanibacter sp.]